MARGSLNIRTHSVVRSRKVSAERQKGQVQAGRPNYGRERPSDPRGDLRNIQMRRQ